MACRTCAEAAQVMEAMVLRVESLASHLEATLERMQEATAPATIDGEWCPPDCPGCKREFMEIEEVWGPSRPRDLEEWREEQREARRRKVVEHAADRYGIPR